MTNEERTNRVLEKIKSGDKQAFNELVSLYEKSVYRISHRFFYNEDDALDATQDVFLKVYRNLDKFEGKSSFNTWLYRITTNTCLTISEKKKKEKEGLLQIVMGWWNSFSQTTPEEKVIDNEERTFNQKLIGENIAKLPEIYRIPLILKDMEGMAMEKISEVLDVPLGTVKSRLNRGRAMLHDKLVNSMKVNNI